MHAKILSISARNTGDAFDTAASTGDTTLSLYDVSDFDEDGGHVVLNYVVGTGGTVYTYDSVDMVADTIHLTTGLTASAAVDDPVTLWDNDLLVPVTERVALVTIDGQGDGDALSVDVDHSLSHLLDRTTWAVGQSVTVVEDGDGYMLTRVHGKENLALQKSKTNGLYYGMDVGDGNTMGLFTNNTNLVRIHTNGDFRVKNGDASVFMPILASAFTVSSDSSVKTDVAEPPDALEIIAAAPASTWRYKTDDDGVQRVGPMADELPGWLAQVDSEDGTLTVDLARMNGVLWTAVGQLQARIEALEKKV